MSEQTQAPARDGETGQPREQTRPRRQVTLNERPSIAFVLVKTVAIGVGIIGCVVIGFFVASQLGFIPAGGFGKQEAAQSLPASPAAAQRTLEDTTAAGQQRAQLALAKTRQQQALDRAREVLRVIDEWLSELKGFQTETAAILGNEEGKAVAGSPELLSQFGAVDEEKRPGREKAQDIRSSVERLTEAVQASFKDPADGSIPPEDLTKQLSELLVQAKSGRDAYREAREQVESLAAHARLSGTPGKLTLKEALAALRRERALKAVAIIHASSSKAREETTRKLAEAKADFERQQGDQAVRKLQEDKQRMLEQKKQERLLALANDRAIQEKFSPFLAEGCFLFGDQRDRGGARSQQPVPVPYSNLVRFGYVGDVASFARSMAGQIHNPFQFGTYDVLNDRPTKPMPSTRDDWKRAEQDLQLFRTLAPIWVKQGKLGK